MAISWGPIASAGGSKECRVGIDLYTDGTWSDTQRWVADIWLWTRVNVTESQGVLSTTGSLGSVSLTGQNFSTSSGTAWSTANQKKVRSSYVDFARPYGSGTAIYCTASLSGITYMGRSLTASHTVWATVDPRPYNLPGAPGAVNATRNSDTSHTVAWVQASSTGDAPIQRTMVERTTGTGGWALIANIEGVASSFTDVSTVPNERYQWRIRNYNSSGYSAYSSLSPISFTTPAAPSGVTVEKIGTDIRAAWTNSAPWATSYVVQDAPSGGAWVQVGTPSSSPWLHTSPPASQTHRYRVAAVVGGLTSAWSGESATVQLQAPPAPPTNLTGGVADPAEPVTLAWLHNPVDSSAQRQYQLRYHRQGLTAWTEDAVVVSAVSRHVVPAGAWTGLKPVVEYQVRTWGAHATASGWSATQLLALSDRPVMGITSPADTLQSGVVTAAWTYTDAEGSTQAGWRARLLVGGQVVETRSGADVATSTTFTHRVADGATVTVEGEVQDSAGLWSVTASSGPRPVVYALPPAPEVTVSYDPATGTASLSIESGAGTPPAVSHRVLSELPEGGWRVIADQVPPDSSVVDLTPTLGAETRYRVEAVSALPSTSATTVTATFDAESRFWLTAPDGTSVYGIGNPGLGVTTGRAREVVGYEGREWPVEHVGSLRSQKISLSVTVTPALGSRATDWEALARAGVPVCARTPDGRRMWCSLGDVGASAERRSSTHISVSLTRIGTLDEME